MNTTWPMGFITALVTPLRADDSIDHDELASLVKVQIDAGVAGVVVGGGTGEFGALSIAERRSVLETVAAANGGRIGVIAQIGALSTRDALELIEHAVDAHADGLLVASPFGEPISWPERQTFYSRVNGASSLPIMIYNTPPSGILNLTQVQKVAELEHVSAIKDSSGDFTHFYDLAAWGAKNDFAVYGGVDSLLFESLLAGAAGAVFGTGNVLARELVAFSASVHGGTDMLALVNRWKVLRPALRRFEESSNYVGAIKAIAGVAGAGCGQVREPYLMPDDTELTQLVEAVSSVRLDSTTEM